MSDKLEPVLESEASANIADSCMWYNTLNWFPSLECLSVVDFYLVHRHSQHEVIVEPSSVSDVQVIISLGYQL